MQRCEAVETGRTFPASERRIPYEPGRGVTNVFLEAEFKETSSFRERTLKQDPRLQPADFNVSFGHLQECTWCAQRARAQEQVHAPAGSPRAGANALPQLGVGYWQWLVDDRVVHSWRNLVRFRLRPRVRVAMRPTYWRHGRFGCPCSAALRDDGVQLWFASGFAQKKRWPGARYESWPQAYSTTWSPSGELDNWSIPVPLRLDGYPVGWTGTLAVTLQVGRLADESTRYLAGYEGAHSTACLARSVDGIDWTTESPPEKRTQRGDVEPQMPLELDRRPLPAAFGRYYLDTYGAHQAPKHLMPFRTLGRGKRPGNAARYLEARGRLKACKDELNDCGKDHKTMQACVLRKLDAHLLPRRCAAALLSDGGQAAECVDGTRSRLGRAADSYVQRLGIGRGGKDIVLFRKDFGGPGGWREIRGVQVAELPPDPKLATWLPFGQTKVFPDPSVNRVIEWYLDRLGKLERFRRQIYSLTLTKITHDLWIGLMTVIEWPKDTSECESTSAQCGSKARHYKRDTTNVYLVTSRDGVHVDDEWVYARKPLIPKPSRMGADSWYSGFILPAAQIVTDGESHRVFFEARTTRHEDRFNSVPKIGVASWPMGRIAGIRVLDVAAGGGMLETKAFICKATALQLILNMDTADAGPAKRARCISTTTAQRTLLVELLHVADGTTLHRKAITGQSNLSLALQWSSSSQNALRLRFTLGGTAALFAFKVLC